MGSPFSSNNTKSVASSCATISLRLTSVVSSVAGAASVTATSVEAGTVGDASRITGASVAAGSSVVTGSLVGGRTSGVASAGGVASSANTLIGKTSDKINEDKITTDTNVNFFMLF